MPGCRIPCQRRVRRTVASLRCRAVATSLQSCTFPGVRSRTQGTPLSSQMAWSLVFSLRLSCGRYHEPRPPFSAACAAVDLDATAVDEQPVRRLSCSRQRAEDAFPDAALGPSDEPVIKRLLRPINISTVSPTAAAAKGMDAMPLNTRRSSTRRLPRTSVGSSGSIRAHCASENQKKSDISPPPC